MSVSSFLNSALNLQKNGLLSLTDRRCCIFHKIVEIYPFGTSSHVLKNFYETLEISPEATSREIKNAYYKLSKKYHPDTNHGNPGAKLKFQEISEAYATLSDSNLRRKYDTGAVFSYTELARHKVQHEVFMKARSDFNTKSGEPTTNPSRRQTLQMDNYRNRLTSESFHGSQLSKTRYGTEATPSERRRTSVSGSRSVGSRSTAREQFVKYDWTYAIFGVSSILVLFLVKYLVQ